MSARVWREVNSSRQRHVWDILSSVLRQFTYYPSSVLMFYAQGIPLSARSENDLQQNVIAKQKNQHAPNQSQSKAEPESHGRAERSAIPFPSTSTASPGSRSF